MTAVTAPGSPLRSRIRVVGVVQGVGFRPFVHRLACELGLAGHVGNDTEGVFMEVEGPAAAVECFTLRLVAEAPPLAKIFAVDAMQRPLAHDRGFRIVESPAAGAARTFVSPDIAVCDDCLTEMSDPANRRARYPFINCTNCGPRFTITVRLPYDRPNTTMGGFAMCDACAAEYNDPSDRRFHAQPVACEECGPSLCFEGEGRVVEGTDAVLAAAQDALARGAVVAIKGLGGYHLACDAGSDAAVERLRLRKHRRDKPLAVMVPDLAQAQLVAEVGPEEARLLTSPQRPIVLLQKHSGSLLSSAIAPGNPRIGVLLPYTPLHHLLFRPVAGATAAPSRTLVMTSGNLTDEPICFDDEDARRRLAPIADCWLSHDRPIHVPCDDSVVQVESGVEVPIRRSRGYAPLPVRLPFPAVPTLAVGGELKNAFCLASGRDAFMSQHIGDMGSLETRLAFERSTRQFEDFYRIDPVQVAADAHPDYTTRRWADDASGRPVRLVHHHHAHVAAVMVEHAIPAGERVIGIAFDGTGYGLDGTIWGGEVLVAGYDTFTRPLHLRQVPLPGGDAAVRKPYRTALAHLWSAGIEWDHDIPAVGAAPQDERAVLRRQLERGVSCVPTSSMGRLFDAVSSLLGIRHEATYEAQAAVELEWCAAAYLGEARSYRFSLSEGEFDAAPVLDGIVRDLRSGLAVGAMAAGFHAAVAQLIADAAQRQRDETGIDRVALTGGVFQNMLLVDHARRALAAYGFRVLTHRVVPPNDGGLALGQAAIAGYRRPEQGGA